MLSFTQHENEANIAIATSGNMKCNDNLLVTEVCNVAFFDWADETDSCHICSYTQRILGSVDTHVS